MQVLYIHGYSSSPSSDKARSIADFCTQQGLAFTALRRSTEDPDIALNEYRQQIAGLPNNDDRLLVGSSLGGFFALQLARELPARCLLINPSIQPQNTLERYGVPPSIARKYARYSAEVPSGTTVLLATDDETLDYRVAKTHFQNKADVHCFDHQTHRWTDMGIIHDYISTTG